MDLQNTVVYISAPMSDLEECGEALTHPTHFASIQNWKFVGLLSLVINI